MSCFQVYGQGLHAGARDNVSECMQVDRSHPRLMSFPEPFKFFPSSIMLLMVESLHYLQDPKTMGVMVLFLIMAIYSINRAMRLVPLVVQKP